MSIKDKLIAAGYGEEEAAQIAKALEAAEPKPEEPTPEEPKPEEPKPEEPKPEEPKPEEPKPEEPKPEEPKPEEPKPEEPEPEEPKPDPTAENAALRKSLIDAELRNVALESGVNPARIEVLKKLATTADLDAASGNLHDLIIERVRAALEEVPELVENATGTGTLGNHARFASRPMTAFERGLLG